MKSKFLLIGALCGVLCIAPFAAQAQESTFKVTAPTITQRQNPLGVRLDGNKAEPARVQSPQLEVQAGVIAFDYIGKQITEVRALTQAGHRVSLKVDLTPQGGGTPTHLEATANEATLNPPARTLVLKGNVEGFYQLQQGVKTTFSGEMVNIKYEGENLQANVTGGAKGFRLEVPPEAINQPGALGRIVFTSQNAVLDKNGGVVRLIGNARAVSDEGENKFDITATEFILTRTGTGGGTIDSLKTVGRTNLKMDLPPEPATGSTPVAVTDGSAKQDIGRPTHIEAAADAMTITRPQNQLVFEGNVTGFYQLAATGDQTPGRYNFSGDRVVVNYAPQPGEDAAAGLTVEVTGQPSSIELPGFNLGF